MSSALTIARPHTELRHPARELQFNVVVAAAVFLTYLFTTYRLSENLQTVGVLSLFGVLALSARQAKPWILWAVVTFTLLAGIIARPLDVPNHHFMLTYLAATLTLSLSAAPEAQFGHVQRNARWLLVGLMAFATVQKLLSPSFMDGSYLGHELAGGGFCGPLLAFFGDVSSATAENQQLIDTLRETPPHQLESVTFREPFPHIPALALAFVALIILTELWLCVAMWLFPKRLISHISLMGFAVTLGVLRQEFTFISVVCTLGLLSCDADRRWLRAGYGLLAIVFAACVMKTINAGSQL